MFYPVDSLKRGGRFYLCWVADSWPLRFATITHRQLWSQDIRKICDDLLQVMTNESGRPACRFSLRLSSQLMRGLVRLYQRKVTVFLSELCMINANVIKHANKKYAHEEIDLHEDQVERRRPVLQRLPQIVLPEEAEVEPRVEELIQNSGNVVTNIQDITLKEAAIPDFQLLPNDGFGEENINQTLQLLADRTVEMMMVPTEVSAQRSGLDLPILDSTDKSQDKSRLVPELQMERISEHDMTLFRKLTGEGLLPPEEIEKEIPEIPDIPIPEMPPQDKQLEQEKEVSIPVEIPAEVVTEAVVVPQPEVIELEELETEPQRKRRRHRGLIIDKKIMISGEQIRARINNINVELRCETSLDDVADLRVPFDILMKRPCHAGFGLQSKVSRELEYLFVRNLAGAERPAVVEREIEVGAMQRSTRSNARSMLEIIPEIEEPVVTPRRQFEQELAANITYPDIEIQPPQSVSKEVIETREQDIAEMLTQKIDILPEQARKRKSVGGVDESPKRARHMGYMSFRESQQRRQTVEQISEVPIVEPEIPILETEINKENIPDNLQSVPGEVERSVTAMLQEVGLADVQTYQPIEQEPVSQRPTRKNGSSSSETMLGSLDRTKVSLGESEKTTDSRRFIRDQWGAEGTMTKILKLIKKGRDKLDIDALLNNGPLISGYKKMIAARCFSSILKLKQHGFIKVKKYENLEIEEIILGPKFKNSP